MGTGRAEGKNTVRAAGSLEEQGFVDFSAVWMLRSLESSFVCVSPVLLFC